MILSSIKNIKVLPEKQSKRKPKTTGSLSAMVLHLLQNFILSGRWQKEGMGIETNPLPKLFFQMRKSLVSNINKANAYAKFFISSNKNHTNKFLVDRIDIENIHPETFQSDVPLTDEPSPLNKSFYLYELETAINGLEPTLPLERTALCMKCSKTYLTAQEEFR
jgi:hypothetical protein